jgi:hypothetical protein
MPRFQNNPNPNLGQVHPCLIASNSTSNSSGIFNSWSNLSLNHSLHNYSLMRKINLCMDCKTSLRKTYSFYFSPLSMAGREVVNLINLLRLCPNGLKRVFPKFILLFFNVLSTKIIKTSFIKIFNIVLSQCKMPEYINPNTI